MNRVLEATLNAAYKTSQKIKPNINAELTEDLAQFKSQAASDIIKENLVNTKPVMICRFGMVELYCLLTWEAIKRDDPVLSKFVRYITGKSFPFWWDTGIKREMARNAGFINPSEKYLTQFCELMEKDIPFVDVLGTWVRGEQVFIDRIPKVVTIRIWDIEPFKHQNPWSEALRGKKVLIVHPYEKSIKHQYAQREKLFRDSRVLPEFELKTIKAVQSIAYNETPFQTWFEALDSMKENISNTDFDIAVIGCGAYGFPLAAHVKRLGKKAIHMGGATQLLFGIKGKRWEEDPYYFKNVFNDYWIKPNTEETPQNFNKIENGCYW